MNSPDLIEETNELIQRAIDFEVERHAKIEESKKNSANALAEPESSEEQKELEARIKRAREEGERQVAEAAHLETEFRAEITVELERQTQLLTLIAEHLGA
jgi:2',3'-cyclic-nucleotide 2'-phosphodiesterase (5'-nucleotidase family)